MQPDDSTLKTVLSEAKTIAVVGLSDKPERPSYDVATYLQSMGYRIIPVNPMLKVWKGKACYPSLRELPDMGTDIIVVFRKSEEAGAAVDDALARWPQGFGIDGKARTIWMQLGIRDDEAAARAEKLGWRVVRDRCIKIEHGRLEIQRK